MLSLSLQVDIHLLPSRSTALPHTTPGRASWKQLSGNMGSHLQNADNVLKTMCGNLPNWLSTALKPNQLFTMSSFWSRTMNLIKSYWKNSMAGWGLFPSCVSFYSSLRMRRVVEIRAIILPKFLFSLLSVIYIVLLLVISSYVVSTAVSFEFGPSLKPVHRRIFSSDKLERKCFYGKENAFHQGLHSFFPSRETSWDPREQW